MPTRHRAPQISRRIRTEHRRTSRSKALFRPSRRHSTSPNCRRSNRSPRKPTSGSSCRRACRAHLTRAALRRAWSADPAIRDFKEMAENQYDFATGSDLPGFGSLDASADDIRKMVADVFGDGPKTLVEQQSTTPPEGETPAETGSSEIAKPSAELTSSEDIAASPQDQRPPESAPAEPVKDVVHRNKVTVAAQQSNTEVEYDPMPSRRPHGRALPQ